MWNIENMQEIGIFKGHKKCIYDFKLSSDEKTIYSCSHDYTIRIWDVDT